jgi:hypothetical protein
MAYDKIYIYIGSMNKCMRFAKSVLRWFLFIIIYFCSFFLCLSQLCEPEKRRTYFICSIPYIRNSYGAFSSAFIIVFCFVCIFRFYYLIFGALLCFAFLLPCTRYVLHKSTNIVFNTTHVLHTAHT